MSSHEFKLFVCTTTNGVAVSISIPFSACQYTLNTLASGSCCLGNNVNHDNSRLIANALYAYGVYERCKLKLSSGGKEDKKYKKHLHSLLKDNKEGSKIVPRNSETPILPTKKLQPKGNRYSNLELD